MKLASIITEVPKVLRQVYFTDEADCLSLSCPKLKNSRVREASASGYIFWIMTWNLPAKISKIERKRKHCISDKCNANLTKKKKPKKQDHLFNYLMPLYHLTFELSSHLLFHVELHIIQIMKYFYGIFTNAFSCTCAEVVKRRYALVQVFAAATFHCSEKQMIKPLLPRRRTNSLRMSLMWWWQRWTSYTQAWQTPQRSQCSSLPGWTGLPSPDHMWRPDTAETQAVICVISQCAETGITYRNPAKRVFDLCAA